MQQSSKKAITYKESEMETLAGLSRVQKILEYNRYFIISIILWIYITPPSIIKT